MGRRKQPPEYFEARQALNKHLHRHHGTTGLGMLASRLDIHEDLHAVARRRGEDVGHKHEPCDDGETDIQLAWRMLREGEEQLGPHEKGPNVVIAQDRASQDRRVRRSRNGQTNS